MTNSISENYVYESINLMVESITTTTNQCTTQVNSGQFFFINGGSSDGCKVTASGKNVVTTNLSCYATTAVMNQVSNNISQAAQQAATSIQQQFGLASFSEAINVDHSYINLSNIIQTTFYNSCITNISNAQVAVINCGNSTNFTADVDFSNTTNVTQDCVFKNASVTTVQNDLTQYVDQTAYSEIQNYIAGIMMAFAMVLFAFAAIIFLVLMVISPKKKQDAPEELTQIEAEIAALEGTTGTSTKKQPGSKTVITLDKDSITKNINAAADSMNKKLATL